MTHPIILWQLARSGAGLGLPRRPSAARRRVRRPLARPGRRRATDDPTVPPSAATVRRRAATPLSARMTARLAAAMQAGVAFAAVLAGRSEAAASASRAALKVLEPAGAVRHAERATCDSPNCAGHRTRA